MGRSAGHPRYALVDALNREWQSLAGSTEPSVRLWAGRHPELRGCRDLDDVLVAVRGSADAVLSVLLAEVRGGCRLAARAVLQAMLGKLVLMARRTVDVSVDDFVIALWSRIATYPLARRPQRIAANLALDALKDAKRLAAEELSPAELSPLPTGERFETWLARRAPARSPTAPELIAAAVNVAVIPPATGEVLVSVYVVGLSGRQAALRHDITPELVRHRCSQATSRMRTQISAVLAVA